MVSQDPTNITRVPRHAAAEDSVVLALEACVTSEPARQSMSAGSPLHASAESVDALRGCVTEYATALRMIDERPERVLIGLKSILDRAVPRSLDADAFKRVAITWCIEAYYAQDQAPPATS